MEKIIKVARYRNTPYVFNFIGNGGTKRYEWSGSKGNKFDTKQLPEEAVDWLMMNSECFRKGELVIIEDSEESKEIIENLGGDLDEYKSNIHTKEEILKILQGNYMKMQKELFEITVASEKKFVIDIAKEIGDDLSGGKLKFLAEWMDIPQDVLFG
ncbi:hypothetical protein SAMN04487895_101744 [Paenibacillus sophorae]|uniref:Uncharacterized protein n=1 Tax=Paenibacillus sophorae TaxID=1333845 RepID=A0A1H8H3C6_9BACL|nr:hypothetical protein [Paenibacillus sophorae]QWU14432.1 hypothetical protein KP014_21225 [Paenibacillus sophorae]SEN50746.1 hypothetical protein SAMN04487895_101744 [Paenibacillus sophorae]